MGARILHDHAFVRRLRPPRPLHPANPASKLHRSLAHRADAPRLRFPSHHAREASKAVARANGLPFARTGFVARTPPVGNNHVLLHQEYAFVGGPARLRLRMTLTAAKRADPDLLEESRRTLVAPIKLLGVGPLHPFQDADVRN